MYMRQLQDQMRRKMCFDLYAENLSKAVQRKMEACRLQKK